MVDQPYTVCRPVTTVRQEVKECGYYERQYTEVPGPIVEKKVRVPVEDGGCGSCGLFGCFHRRRVTATVAVQCPPRVVSQRVFVSRPVVRNVTETRYVRETMVRQVPVTSCRYVAEERVESIPVTTCSYVSEEHVEPYQVRTCRYVPEERVESIPVTTCSYVAEERVEPYEVRTCEMVAEERVESIPVTTCSYATEERVEPYEVRTCQYVAEERVETDPGDHMRVCRRTAGGTRSRDDVPHGRRDRVASGAGICARRGSGHDQPMRGPCRSAADRGPADHLCPGGRPDVPDLRLTERSRSVDSKRSSSQWRRSPNVGTPPLAFGPTTATSPFAPLVREGEIEHDRQGLLRTVDRSQMHGTRTEIRSAQSRVSDPRGWEAANGVGCRNCAKSSGAHVGGGASCSGRCDHRNLFCD